MATIQDLFKSKQKEIYGNDNIRIESRGLINPPRGAALLASSPNAIADLIGNQIGGALGGSANRPSDTIFGSKFPLAKPISIFRSQQGLRNAVQPETDYFVKQSPSPNSILATLQQGSSNPAGLATSLAIKGVTKGGLKELKDKLKKKDGNPYNRNKKYSDFKTVHNLSLDGTKAKGILEGKEIVLKSNNEKIGWHNAINDIQETEKFANRNILEENIKKYRDSNQVWVTFQRYGKQSIIPFVGVISGLSEDITPEWTSFKYIGSPFKTNRYQGVERSLKFNLKLYYTTGSEKDKMIKKINYLKSLTFPYEEISQIKYDDTKTSQYAYSPNLVYVSIGDMYKNVFGYVENLNFTIDETVSWPNENANGNDDGRNALMKTFGFKHDNHLYPSVVEVSIGIKIIENHTTETIGGITKYKYNFDGITYDDNNEYGTIISMNTPFKINEI